jgi:hypothetical protein
MPLLFPDDLKADILKEEIYQRTWPESEAWEDQRLVDRDTD